MRLFVVAAIVVLSMTARCSLAGKEEKVPLDRLPASIREAVEKKFPRATLVSAEKETEDGVELFEVALKHQKHDLDVTLTVEGEFREIETSLLKGETPEAVARAINEKYPDSKIRKLERIIAVKDGAEQPAAYEAKLSTKDRKNLEVKFDADGKVLKVEVDDEA